MEGISRIRQSDAVGKQLCDICAKFRKKRYQDILEAVLVKNQSRFCSSKLHNAFVFPACGDTASIRQNMMIEPTTIDNEVFALIQINDITNQVTNEHKLTSLITELKKGYLEVIESAELHKQLAQTDPLTRLANRSGINKYTEEMFRNGTDLKTCALMFLDLDGFKSVNDTYGHLMGDNLLIEVAGILKRKMRKDDVVARIGGDEFLILLYNMESLESLEIVGQKLVDEIAKPVCIDNQQVHVTVSIGIAPYDKSFESAIDFIKAADDAMYRAKREGKNKYVICRRK
jgi:diguanylate cyclase (GGDEF)-like protein